MASSTQSMRSILVLAGLLSQAVSGHVYPRQVASNTASVAGTVKSPTKTIFSVNNKQQSTPDTTPPSSGCAILPQSTGVSSFSEPGQEIVWTVSAPYFCTCAGGGIAAMITSQANDGTMYSICAVPGGLSSPLASATPSSIPGSANNPDWLNVSCSTPPLDDAFSNATEQWDVAGASAAWDAAVNYYELGGSDVQQHNLSNAVANFFHSTVNSNCEDLSSTECTTGPNCGQGAEPNAPVDSPAGYLIMNSIVAIHAVMSNINSDLQNAVGQIGLQSAQYAQQFSVVDQSIMRTIAEQEQQKHTWDIIQSVFNVVSVFSFGVGFKSLLTNSIAKDTSSALGSTLYGAMSNVFTSQKDAFSTKNFIYEQSDIQNYLSLLTTTWQQAIINSTANILGNPNTLGGMLANGSTFLHEQGPMADFNQEQNLIAAAFAGTLSTVWRGGALVGMPFILNTDNLQNYTSSGNDDTSRCGGFNPFTDSTMEQTWNTYSVDANLDTTACFEHDGSVYWLLQVRTKNTKNDITDAVPIGTYLTEPYGINNLNGTSDQYGGLNKSTVQNAAVTTWLGNGKSNVATSNTIFDDQSYYASLFDSDTLDISQIQGLVNIPVCDLPTFLKVLDYDTFGQYGNPAWPCWNSTDPVPDPLPGLSEGWCSTPWTC